MRLRSMAIWKSSACSWGLALTSIFRTALAKRPPSWLPREATARSYGCCWNVADIGGKAVWHQALKSLLFASRAVPMTMKIVAAAAGAMAFQALAGLFASPARGGLGLVHGGADRSRLHLQ